MTPPSSITGRWRTCNYPELLQETWNGETFLFNPASGDTHLLNAAAIHLLEFLHQESASFDQMTDTLFPDADEATLDALATQFHQLMLIGLICEA